MASRLAKPRIAICGSGVAGPCLAGILANQVGKRIRIDLFERTPEGSDQGYGLDLDAHGQEALVRAGVYDQFWSRIAYPRSDQWAIMGPGGEKLSYIFRPRLLQRLFPATFGARPECSRGAMREVMLEAAGRSGDVGFHSNTTVRSIRRTEDGLAELTGSDGDVLGKFDLVVDAMGWNSSLREMRVTEKDVEGGVVEGKRYDYDGTVMIHGSIEDPAQSWSEMTLSRWDGVGNFVVMGDWFYIVQRYGGGPRDKRCAFISWVVRPTEDEIFPEIGIEKPTSRNSSILTGGRLEKVKGFLHKQTVNYDHCTHEIIESLARATVRPSYQTLRLAELRTDSDAVEMPLVCIGDALQHCGLGGGGILAMQDTLELGRVLSQPEIDLPAVRAIEPGMLARKREFVNERRRGGARNRTSFDWRVGIAESLCAVARRAHTADTGFLRRFLTSSSMCRFVFDPAIRLCFGLLRFWRSYLEKPLFGAGSDSTSPIFPNVVKAIEEEKAGKRW